jgi:ATPase subunit of ABC transporter with duplicated ATPase domains
LQTEPVRRLRPTYRFLEGLNASQNGASAAQRRRASAGGMLIAPPPPGPDPLLSITGAAFGYDEASPPVLDSVSLVLRPGERLLLLGANGTGKSTLLHGISGRLRPREGRRVAGKFLQLLLWEQAQRDDLEEEESPLDFFVRVSGGGTNEESALSALGDLGIDRFAARRSCGCLSSGERTMMALGALGLVPKHLLLLDEPTAFLGAVAIAKVAEVLAAWPGAVVFCSGSRALCEALQPTRVARVHGGTLHLHDRPPVEADWATVAVDRQRQAEKRAREEVEAHSGEGARQGAGVACDPPTATSRPRLAAE